MAWIHFSVVWSLVIKRVKTCTLYTWEGKPIHTKRPGKNIGMLLMPVLEPKSKLTTATIYRLFHAQSSATKEKLEI
jgi:hypothetical protein